MIYIYSDEDGLCEWSNEAPSADDMEAIDEGICGVLRVDGDAIYEGEVASDEDEDGDVQYEMCWNPLPRRRK